MYLHNSKKKYSRKRLEIALGILDECMSSNFKNLLYVLDFVLNPQEEGKFSKAILTIPELPIFKQMDISNSTFYHIFNLHKYSQENRDFW